MKYNEIPSNPKIELVQLKILKLIENQFICFIKLKVSVFRNYY